MPLEKLSDTEIAALKGTAPDPIIAEYAAIPGRLSSGEGGKAAVADEKATRFTVRKRIQAAADGAGIHLKVVPHAAGGADVRGRRRGARAEATGAEAEGGGVRRDRLDQPVI